MSKQGANAEASRSAGPGSPDGTTTAHEASKAMVWVPASIRASPPRALWAWTRQVVGALIMYSVREDRRR
ncbi:hypothetical protein ABT383_24510 [Streptomyces humidus]|uniref:hypothetical protein n=1 Tax=Streptomyces humidus TaxID=52259 RepID=UPI00167D3273|nr:hypothetical protein [Streptomyces humidus]